MEIAILTFHCAHNYGAVLQVYALQEFLKEQGHQVHVVDYRPEYLIELYRPFSLRRCKQGGLLLALKIFMGECLRYKRQLKRFAKFDRFITKRLNLLAMNSLRASNDMDVFILGSDQIWNPVICKGFDPVYFGDFSAARGKKKIAYAASLGKSNLIGEEYACLKRLLQSIDVLCVREDSLKKMLLNVSNKNIYQVIDPTLLVSEKVFDQIAVKPVICKPYVLVYQVLRDDSEIMDIAQHLAKQIDGVVIEVLSVIKKWKSTEGKLETASPEEFLGYIKQAHCVVTSSFHGTAFSIIMRRPFYTLKLNSDLDVRALSLLNSLGLEGQMVQKGERPDFSVIDYDEISTKIAQLQAYSRSVLLESIDG